MKSTKLKETCITNPIPTGRINSRYYLFFNQLLNSFGDKPIKPQKLSTLIILGFSLLLPILATAASKVEIDTNIEVALEKFYAESAAGKRLAERSKGMLVFPRVVKAGIGIGGEYGEGALMINGSAVDYYNTAGASIGFQLGAQVKSQIILFMTDDALDTFRSSDGWEAGVDGSVAVVEFGAGGEISSNSAQQPIIGFIFSNKGLMYNLTFEGSKMTKIER
ncbi:YSC84-related protein [Gammaproteobacteria bacterium]|nr:YSC84-related protein [Gammaproteobacteria bacterium]